MHIKCSVCIILSWRIQLKRASIKNSYCLENWWCGWRFHSISFRSFAMQISSHHPKLFHIFNKHTGIAYNPAKSILFNTVYTYLVKLYYILHVQCIKACENPLVYSEISLTVNLNLCPGKVCACALLICCSASILDCHTRGNWILPGYGDIQRVPPLKQFHSPSVR